MSVHEQEGLPDSNGFRGVLTTARNDWMILRSSSYCSWTSAVWKHQNHPIADTRVSVCPVKVKPNRQPGSLTRNDFGTC